MIQSLIIQSASFNADEIEVSNILLNLKGQIEESESRSRTRTSERNLGFNFNSPSRNVERNFQIEEEERDDDEIERKFVKLKSEKTGLDIPFLFSPIENNGKPKKYSSEDQTSSRKRKTREELMCNIEKLTRCRELLREEVKKVQSYYNHQQAYNLELKAMREKVMTNLNGQEPESSHKLQYPMGQLPQAQPFSSSAYGLGFMNHKSPIGIPHHKYQYPMGHLPQTQPMFSSTIGLGFVSYTGPVVGIPNLNIVATNSKCPFENNRDIAERKAKYREARRKRRMKIIEIKRSSGQKDR